MKTIVIEEKERIESIISRSEVCFVGITDLEGNPYVIPMNFGYSDGSIYLHSAPEGEKLEMLAKNNHVCITFSVGHELVYQHPTMACSYSMRSESAQCKGTVGFIEDLTEKRQALDIIMKHYSDREFSYSEPSLRNVQVWQVVVTHMSGKVFGLRPNEQP